MAEEQPSYKVTDRRLFNSDGTPREVPPEEKPEVKPAADETSVPLFSPLESATPPSQRTPSETQPPQQAAETGEDDHPGAESELPGVEDPASFSSFMMSIASNAASSLGMMEHPVTGKREVELELGKHWIDVLGMLQQKTTGNLLPQEKQILEGLLADLRMQYVSLANATPPKASRTYTGRDITGG
jgi:hypothetical protein